ncbi:MAG: hypothetical protein D6797_07915 [Bdellovibrio sp.]|nr:MAG: hypothetical protein D6797_07915 [Bdellovibrio sp.]
MGEMDELLPEYIEESKDLLEEVNDILERASETGVTEEDIQVIFRNIHTIKGGASMFGMENTQKTAHELENFLGQCKENKDLFDYDKVRDAVDTIEALIQNHDQLKMKEEKNESGEKPSEAEALNQEEAVQKNDSPAKTVETVGKDTQKFESQDFHKDSQKINHQKSSKNDQGAAGNRSSSSANEERDEVLRVPLSSINKALNNIWEIFLLRNQLSYLIEKNKDFLKKNPDFIQEWDILDASLRRNISEIESHTMRMRMSPLKNIFVRMEKVVRSYTKETGKKIRVSTQGKNIELDKKVIDMLAEPMVHLIRNAMDHGIETPEERKEKGKEEEGHISIEAQIVSDKVIVKVQDDGRGIDAEKLKQKAIQNGLDISHLQNEEDAVNLIFHPGLSTAEKVSDVSGRGVGMDAVKTSILSLGGEVFVETQLGQGTLFTIELPLSMSVVSSIIYEINGREYASPINDIIEICRDESSKIVSNNDELFFSFRDEFIPCLDLRKVYHSDSFKEEDEVTACVLRCGERKVALRVSKVKVHTDLVVKETKDYFQSLPEISGVTILATGKPIFMLPFDRILKKMSCYKPERYKHAG